MTHLHLVCFADALLTPLRVEHHGAQGQPTHCKAADRLTAAAQEQLQGLIWDDLLTYLQGECPGQSALEGRARLRVA
jgi:hypothetical protein